MSIQNQVDPSYSDLEYSENKPTEPEEEIIRRAVVRLNGHILGFVIGLTAALGIFAATNFLVFKGGEVVGPHLGLLDQFLLGYSVSFIGSLIGALYLFVTGYIVGLFVAFVYNWVASFRSN
ncbi:MAG: hypothetical protein IT173_11865 [Acidobacteria bacterium]|nr:hypothetical protein [Acidobacteriota bacterium]